MGNLASALDELTATEWASMPGPALAGAVIELTEASRRLDAARLAALGAFDVWGEWAIDGSLSAGAWVSHRCRMAPGSARADVKLASRLREMPHTAAALAEGAISVDHARAIAEAAPVARFDEAEAMLADQARALRVDDTRRVVTLWREVVGDERLADLPGRRRLHVSETFEGMVALDGRFDPELGAVVHRAIRCAVDRSPDLAGESRRTGSQRNADAMGEICDRYLRDIVGSGTNHPHVVVTVDLATLEGRAGRPARTTDGQALTGDAARRFACDAEVTRVITDPESRPLDLGRTTRVVPGSLRTALIARDGGCVFPGCDRPPERCDADHVVPWWAGGPTALSNLALLCGRHHTLKHRGVFRIRADGSRPRCTRPDGSSLGGHDPP